MCTGHRRAVSRIRFPGEKDGNMYAEQSVWEKMEAYQSHLKSKKMFQEETDGLSTDCATQVVELRPVNLIN